MKLSERGIETIFSALRKTIEERDLVFRRISQGVFKKHIEALEFEPDDFIEVQPKPKEPVVELSVEEAKRIKNALLELLRKSNDKNANEWLTYWMVNGRIDQLEAQND